MAGYSIHFATAWGPWAFSDSAAYYSAAQNLLDGQGLVITSASGIHTPLQHYPPFYPLLLAALLRFFPDVFMVARWIDIISFAVFLFSISWFLYRLTSSVGFAVVNAFMLLVFPRLLWHFSGMMSEPIFIMAIYSAILSYILFLQTHQRKFLFFASFFSLITALTRYAGLIIIPLITMLSLFYLHKDKWKLLTIFHSITSIPVGIWFLWVYFNSSSYGAREILPNNNISSRFNEFWSKAGSEFQAWLPYLHYRDAIVPPQAKTTLFVVLLLALVVIFLMQFYKSQQKKVASAQSMMLLVALILFITLYLVFLLMSYVFTTPQPYIDERMLTPLAPAFFMVLLFIFYQILLLSPKKIRRGAAVFLSLIFFITGRYYYLISREQLKELHTEGYGHTARVFRQSQFITEIKQLPEQALLFSNNPAFVLLYTNRMPNLLMTLPRAPFVLENTGQVDDQQDDYPLFLILEFPSLRNIYSDDFEERKDIYLSYLHTVFEEYVGGIYQYPSN